MHNELCDIYGMDVPIFAFSHSPRVIAVEAITGEVTLPKFRPA